MNRFMELIEHIKGSHVYIQTHNFPDPDAIASAYGLSRLLEKINISSSICYKGKIERFSTNDFIKRLDIQLIDLNDIDFNTSDEIILVDSQKGNANIIDTDGDEIICIDHHPTFVTDNVNYRYADIRPEIGACSTIIANYYFENDIEIDTRTATALLYGIKSDTMALSRGATEEDVEVYYKLFNLSDEHILGALEHCSLQFKDLKAYAQAFNSIKVYDRMSFANTGYDCPEALIASISDFMLDLVEIDFTVVYSIRVDGIKLSVRSIGNVDAGIITNNALKGIGSGGGHAQMAGGFVPFSNNLGSKRLEVLIGSLEERFVEEYKKSTRSELKDE